MTGSSFWMGAFRKRIVNLPRDKWIWQWTDGSNWKFTKWDKLNPNGAEGSKFNTCSIFSDYQHKDARLYPGPTVTFF